MEKYIDLAEFKFEFEDRKSIETRCKVGSRLCSPRCSRFSAAMRDAD